MNISKLLLVTLLSTSPLGLNAMDADLKESDSKKQQDAEAAHAKAMAWQCVKTIQMPEGPVQLSMYGIDGAKSTGKDILVVGDHSGLLTFWDPLNWEPLDIRQHFKKPITTLASYSDAKNRTFVACAVEKENGFYLTTVRQHKFVTQKIDLDHEVTKLRFVRDYHGIQLFSFSTPSQKRALRWNPRTIGQAKSKAAQYTDALHFCTMSDCCYFAKEPKKHILINQSINHPTNITKLTSPSLSPITHVNCGHQREDSTTPSFVIMSGSKDGTLRIWDKATCIDAIQAHDAPITGLELIEIFDGKKSWSQIVSAAQDGTIKIWNYIENPKAKKCAQCDKTGNADIKLSKCAGCEAVRYCSRACQLKHWKEHKPTCRKPAKSSTEPDEKEREAVAMASPAPQEKPPVEEVD